MSSSHDTDQVIEDLKAARDLIANGWCRNALEDGRGNYCVMGAVNQALYGSAYTSDCDTRKLAALQPIWDLIRERGYGWDIPAFNNDPATTHEDVLNVFDKALAELGGLA